MATNQYLPFATSAGANTMTPTAWAALTTILANGFSPGVASSEQFNTLARQLSVAVAALAQWASDTTGANALDDGSVTNFKALLEAAVNTKTGPYLRKDGGTMTGPINFFSNWGVNGITSGTGDGASYSVYDIAFKGWWGMGMLDLNDVAQGYYDFRAGKWDCKGGFYVNGVRVWDNTNFNPGNYLPLTGGTLTGGITLPGVLNTGAYLFGEPGNDTGLAPDSDNVFSILNSGVVSATFSPGTSDFTTKVRAASFVAKSPVTSFALGQGTYTGWNASSGGGESNFYCNRGSGAGGFTFTVVNTDGSTLSTPMTLNSNGTALLGASPSLGAPDNTVATLLSVFQKINAVFSKGSNVNGSYFILNTMLIQFGYIPSSNATFTFPLSFSAPPAVMFTPSAQGTANDVGVSYPISSSQFYAGTRSTGGGASNYAGYWVAFGSLT